MRDRIAMRLRDFTKKHGLGKVVTETEFRLSADTSRTPDVAFVTTQRFSSIDIDRSPVEGPPDLAVEVISPSNRTEDTVKKTHQYLDAGCYAVWIIYPGLRRAEIHSQAAVEHLREPDALKEPTLLPGFSLPLSCLFDSQEV